MERLDKLLAQGGFGSRRDVQKLIKSGEVRINGEVCKKPDAKADSEKDEITVGGQAVSCEKYMYIMMNKPAGVVSATFDRCDKTVIDIIPQEMRRNGLFPAGRLDKDTEGLLIITNDGDFAHKMLSPKKHVEKTYIAQLDKDIDEDTIKRFEEGIIFADGTKCLPAKLRFESENCKKTGIVTICEGKFHQVKKMFMSCGIKVVHLKRISIGDLYLDSNLPIGSCKIMTNLDKESVFIGNIH